MPVLSKNRSVISPKLPFLWIVSMIFVVFMAAGTETWGDGPRLSAAARPGKAERASSPLQVPRWWNTVRRSKAPAPLVAVLPAPDLRAIRAEDAIRESGEEKGTMRIGILRDLSEPFVFSGKTLQWQDLDNGLSWAAVSIVSEGALGMRLGFTVLEIPPGMTAWMVDAATGLGMPIVPPAVFAEPLWWGPSCPGQEVWLAFEAAPGSEKE